ncbi:uncharacterized protein BXZ73DRAFT_53443 [Epithele typhae]|uniref:uncharacterized protein n=1 Tax=Epithele typhae TaxID=378194 RepID=UPI002008A6A7|nr:uncharacterized protein BXZ73DRAFT_53443 [Epithele typhae]KAH9917139.1 hypothetical protein BXZ73DRAFT_53443 [Epithele typhae]
MTSLPRWLGKAKASGARLITNEPGDASRPTRGRRSRDAEYADIPPFLLPLSLRVRLDKEDRKTRSHSRNRAQPYDRSIVSTLVLSRAFQMPPLLKRLAGAPTCPIVVAQYKDESRGLGHEEDLHWALVVITDPATLSGPSFQAYAQKKRRHPRPRVGSRAPTLPHASSLSPSSSPLESPSPPPYPNAGPAGAGTTTLLPEPEYELQWYARHAPASLYDVCATVRTLCLGGVQVGAVRAADVPKLVDYLHCHPPVPRHPGWGAREYVLELLELLRPFKMLRPDLVRARVHGAGVELQDLLPELREAGRVTQESIFNEDFRPCVRYH